MKQKQDQGPVLFQDKTEKGQLQTPKTRILPTMRLPKETVTDCSTCWTRAIATIEELEYLGGDGQ